MKREVLEDTSKERKKLARLSMGGRKHLGEAGCAALRLRYIRDRVKGGVDCPIGNEEILRS